MMSLSTSTNLANRTETGQHTACASLFSFKRRGADPRFASALLAWFMPVRPAHAGSRGVAAGSHLSELDRDPAFCSWSCGCAVCPDAGSDHFDFDFACDTLRVRCILHSAPGCRYARCGFVDDRASNSNGWISLSCVTVSLAIGRGEAIHYVIIYDHEIQGHDEGLTMVVAQMWLRV